MWHVCRIINPVKPDMNNHQKKLFEMEPFAETFK